MQVRTNFETRRVVISGTDGTGWYRVELTWSEAANLATLLNEGSRELMPMIPGKVYCPSIER